MCFLYGFHPLLPSLQHSLSVGKPEGPTNVKTLYESINISFPFMFFLYLLVGVTNYLAYGSSVHENVLLNCPKNLGWHFATGAVIVHVLSAYPLYMSPVFHYFESFTLGFINGTQLESPSVVDDIELQTQPEKTLEKEEDDDKEEAQASDLEKESSIDEEMVEEIELSDPKPDTSELPIEVDDSTVNVTSPRWCSRIFQIVSWPSCSQDWVFRILLRFVLVALTLTVAEVVPLFGEMQRLLGGVSLNVLCVAVPAILYMKVHPNPYDDGYLLLCAVIALVGFSLAGFSLFFTIGDYIKFFKS
eukprot:TRINITY_DN2154_c0_g1_i1.p1 TRINITY_DN2154_c0_g1~~TRINITY_DN2154_c0_g1_i1.p1  ORF type:complete len:302 (+),score=68.91 TRINITY_DN2154_c0_g1_i1:677-1582(+)